MVAEWQDMGNHDDVAKWKHFPRYWPFVRGIHQSPVNSPHIGQWRRALMFSLICAWTNGWINNLEAGDLRRHHAHYDVIVIPERYYWFSYWAGLISGNIIWNLFINACKALLILCTKLLCFLVSLYDIYSLMKKTWYEIYSLMSYSLMKEIWYEMHSLIK